MTKSKFANGERVHYEPNSPDRLSSALESFDRNSIRPRIEAAEDLRKEILVRFPKASWPTMPLERYALGQDSKDTYCWWLEFGSQELGSIQGGSAQKHVIFKRRGRSGWFYPSQFRSLEGAWQILRNSFVELFRLADVGNWDQIDVLPALEFGPVLYTKTLHVYYPDEILPIYGRDALRHFLDLFGHPENETSTLQRVALNRKLLSAAREHPGLRGWSPFEVASFLYSCFDPREVRRVVKIAPGENAMYWDECLEGGYICVGWDAVGDLSEYESKSDFRERFAQQYGEQYTRPKLSAKANELWTLRELEPGDIVIANQGGSRVLAVGEVQDPGYEWREDREQFRHTVRVSWDTSYARAIEPQASWRTVTVARVPATLYASIINAEKPKRGGEPPALDPELVELANALERKGQLILYGPPGTGKTYTARRLALLFLLREEHDRAATVLSDDSLFKRTERELSRPQSVEQGSEPRLTVITFHPSYAYEDFIEGFRPYDNGTGALALRMEDGVFKRLCVAAGKHPQSKYVLLIDEINRANLGKVFGEAITLLERDKRDLTLILPQSKQSFTIPPNVYVIGTMNTADRSIKLLDAALRRRFAFYELMPDIELLRGSRIGTFALDEFLEELNNRIAREVVREKKIGHSFLLDGNTPVTDQDEFARRFRQEILPLLQEYCYEDYAALATYLGGELVDRDAGALNTETLNDAPSLVAALEREFVAKESSRE